jgi:GTP-binding protein HflX
VLQDLDAGEIPIITVLNKIDRLESEAADSLLRFFPDSIPVSATEGKGLTELCQRIERTLAGSNKHFRFPLERSDLAALLHRSGSVISEKYGEDFIEMEARVDERTAGKLTKYEKPLA